MAAESYKFDSTFETRVALACACDPDFWAMWGVHLEPEGFQNPSCTLLVRTVRQIASDLGRGPSDVSIVFQRLRRQSVEGKVTSKEIADVTALLDTDVGSVEELAMELRPVLEVRLKQAAAKAAIDSYAGHGDTARVTTLLDTVSGLGRRRDDIGIIFGPASDSELAKLRNVSRLSTGILELDVVLRGGTPKKETCVIIGGYKSGKSMALGQIGATSLMDGYTVAYASLELEKSLIFARFQACLTGVPIDDILETPQGEALAKARLAKLWPRMGTLIVEKFPRRATTATDVLRWVERVQQQLGRKVDVFLLDYLDECVTDNAKENGSEYSARGAVLSRLSEWNIANDVWFWTATQTQRGKGKDPNRRTTGDDVADSIKTMRIVDKAITITNKGEDQLEWFIAANRTGPGNKAVGPFPADFACARVAPVTFDQPW